MCICGSFVYLWKFCVFEYICGDFVHICGDFVYLWRFLCRF